MSPAARDEAEALGPAPFAELFAAARWPQARAEMVDPLLVTCRLAEDVVDQFEAGEELSSPALVALGWPPHVVDDYLERASVHAAAICAHRLARRRQRGRAAAQADPVWFAEPTPDRPHSSLTSPSTVAALGAGASLGALVTLVADLFFGAR